jgi:FixJ family two-component response regulator
VAYAGSEPPRIDGLVEDITRRKESEAVARRAAVAVAKMSMLSPREREVLCKVVDGNANKVIARHLDISEKTVEKHRASVMKKLQVRSVAELVRLAMLAEAAAK